MSSGREPTTDELLAMAYVDGELAHEARAAFEARLALEPALAAEVAAQRHLGILAREVAPPEPLELERLRVEVSAPARALWIVGFALVLLSGVYFLFCEVCALGDFGLQPPLAGVVVLLALGLVLLAYRAWRIRARTRHLDPYRDVKR